MAFYEESNQEDAQECPVCYEGVSGIERTLSCGHVFCHDCLVKTLVSINSNGKIRETISCPICRHLTFIKKQRETLEFLAKNKETNERQTLEVPLSLPAGQLRASSDSFPSGVNWITHCCRCISQPARSQGLIRSNACQIFIISTQGRPMAEEDAPNVVMTVVHPRPRRRRRICTTGRCVVFLLSAFTILALVAATMPWILLV